MVTIDVKKQADGFIRVTATGQARGTTRQWIADIAPSATVGDLQHVSDKLEDEANAWVEAKECRACMGTGIAHVVSYGLSGCPMLDVGPGDCDECDGVGYFLEA